MNKKSKLLFLSTGTSSRSQMAEGFLRTLAGDEFEVASAGIEPSRLDPFTVEVMRETGIDISKQQPQNVAESVKEQFGYVITVCDMARERAPIFPFTFNLIHWSIEDPAVANGPVEERIDAFRRARDTIRDNVQNFINEFTRKNRERSRAASG
jgi:arsenate reductase